MSVLNDNGLPAPLPTMAFGAPIVPDSWNDLAEAVGLNLDHLRASAPRLVATVADLAALTDTAGGLPWALVLGEFSLWVYLHGDDDVTASELEFFGRLRRVGVGTGGWYEVVSGQRLQYAKATANASAGSGQTTNLFDAGLAVTTSGSGPLVVDLNVTGAPGTAGTMFLEILLDGQVVDVLMLEQPFQCLHFRAAMTPGAGEHTVNARIRQIGGTANGYVARRTLTAHVQ